MKKYFFACFATIAFAAITTSATYSNFESQNLHRVNIVYDTTPGTRSDSSGNWNKNNNKNESKNYDSTGNRDKKDSSGSSSDSRPPHK